MNKLDLTLKVEVYNEKKEYFEFYSDKIKIEEIKKKCQEEFKFIEKCKDNIDIWFIDEEGDKNLITNINDIIAFAKEIDSSVFLIKLNVEMYNKINKENKNLDKIEEKKEIFIDNNNQNNNNIIENKIKEKSSLIIRKLKKEIEFLKKIIDNYKETIKNIINFYDNALNEKIKYDDIDELNIKEEKINDINNNILIDEIKNKNLKDDNKANVITQYFNNFEIVESPNQSIKNIEIIFKINKNKLNILDIIYNNCNNCKNLTKNDIYKCIYCDKYYLCQKCHSKNNKNKFHEHEEFYEIKYSEKIYLQIRAYIQAKIPELNKSFNDILNKVFFDKNGNLNKNPFNFSDTKNLKEICQEMISFKLDPLELFADYQVYFIKKELNLVDEQTKIFVNEKLLSFLNKLTIAIQK